LLYDLFSDNDYKPRSVSLAKEYLKNSCFKVLDC